MRLLSNLTEDEPGFISNVVLAETAWVLSRSFRYSNSEIGEALLQLAEATELQLESEPQVLMAIEEARTKNVDFADVLISGVAQRAGCSVTLTFDKDASRLPGFKLAK